MNPFGLSKFQLIISKTINLIVSSPEYQEWIKEVVRKNTKWQTDLQSRLEKREIIMRNKDIKLNARRKLERRNKRLQAVN